MKKHYFGLALLLMSLVIMVSSCKKSPHDDPAKVQTDSVPSVDGGNSSEQPLITRYEYLPNLYTLFKYNTAGRLTDISDINDIAETDRTVTYQAGGKIDKIIITAFKVNGEVLQTNDANSFWKFVYNSNNLLERADAYNNASVRQSYFQCSYDGQNLKQLLFYSNYGGSTIQPRSKIDFQYNAKGDVTRSDTYLWDLSAGSYYLAAYGLYENDDHPNPAYGLRDIFMVLYSAPGPHNFTKAESFAADGSINQNNNYEYQYNGMGYPVSAKKRNLAANTSGFFTLNFVYR